MKLIARFSTLACVLSLGQASIPASSAGSNPIVSVNTGTLRGSLTPDGGAVFKGIPFAQPPTGNLRWRSRFRRNPGPASVMRTHSGRNASRVAL